MNKFLWICLTPVSCRLTLCLAVSPSVLPGQSHWFGVLLSLHGQYPSPHDQASIINSILWYKVNFRGIPPMIGHWYFGKLLIKTIKKNYVQEYPKNIFKLKAVFNYNRCYFTGVDWNLSVHKIGFEKAVWIQPSFLSLVHGRTTAGLNKRRVS